MFCEDSQLLTAESIYRKEKEEDGHPAPLELLDGWTDLGCLVLVHITSDFFLSHSRVLLVSAIPRFPGKTF